MYLFENKNYIRKKTLVKLWFEKTQIKKKRPGMVRSFYTNNKTKSFKRNPTYIFSIEERHFGAENWQMFGSMLQCIEMIYFDLHRQLQLTQR